MTRPIYFDNAATTRVDERVLEAMLPCLRENWGNPGSGHALGREAQRVVSASRRRVAEIFDRRPGDVVFTSGATESDNLALRGSLAGQPGGSRLLISSIEHAAVRDLAQRIREEGRHPVVELPVDDQGRLRLDALEEELARGDVALVSVLAVGNETGVVQDLAAIAERTRAAKVRLHVDAAQAVGKIAVEDYAPHADLFALSAHKFHGPKGVGALVLRRGLRLEPQIVGGGQQRGIRAGTENPAGIVGLATALAIAVETTLGTYEHLTALRERLEAGLRERVDDLSVSAADARRAPHFCHLTLKGIEAEALQIRLDRQGIATSVGSACSTGALEPSHVLLAMGVPEDRRHGALRLSFSRETTAAEIDRFLDTFPAEVEALRRALAS